MLPLQAASNSSLEEFPVDSHQEDINERGSSSEVTTKTAKRTNSPTGLASDEEAALPLKTKPLPKVNALAREIRVKVTGARAGNTSDERDLFAENTSTVLVFEKGGVIRLAAAVTPGQLLFLTNEESKREVVTQVIRKRTYRPTECYVELEFTEAVPGFWGAEFSAATALLPKDAKEAAAAELIASAETTEDELDEATRPPSAAEVDALKKEVEALRSQLNLLQTQAEPALSSTATSTPNAPGAPSSAASPEGQVGEPSAPVAYAQTTGLISQALPLEAEIEPAWVPPAEQKPAPKPTLVFRKSLPPRKRSFRARGEFTPGFRAGMLRLAILSSILGALIGTAWYKGWLPGISQPKKIPVSSWAGGVTTPVSGRIPVSATQTPSTNAPTLINGTSISGALPGMGLPSDPAVKAASGGEKGVNSSTPAVAVEKPLETERNTPAAALAKTTSTHSPPTKTANSVQALGANSIDVPPKLIKSERATASLDDLRDFETGSVVIDAIIDTGGSVTSMKVLSGPPSLRWPALQALKNYKYQPAMQNGRPVAAHVTVKIQFHFEE
ncbi:MAG TPA: energy transducer TonB [Candidatus Acidoferrum sp.]|nr:energy transducer TonB [Candidatus Acidoferrum sp.]